MAKIYRREPLVWIIRDVSSTGNSSGRNVKRFCQFLSFKMTPPMLLKLNQCNFFLFLDTGQQGRIKPASSRLHC